MNYLDFPEWGSVQTDTSPAQAITNPLLASILAELTGVSYGDSAAVRAIVNRNVSLKMTADHRDALDIATRWRMRNESDQS